jgi:hypothetical protein
LNQAEILEQAVSDLTEYSRIPIAFTVDRILEVTPGRKPSRR